MLIPQHRKRFKKDLKSLSIKKIDKVLSVIQKLLKEEPLEEKYQDHALKGKYEGFRECHIEPDLLLIYKVEKDILKLSRIASHSDLF